MKTIETLNLKALNLDSSSREQECAAILGYVHSKLTEDFITRKRADLNACLGKIAHWKKISVVFFILPVLITVALGNPLFMALLLGMSAPLYVIHGTKSELASVTERKPTAKVTRIGEFAWSGTMVPFQNGAMLIDKQEVVAKHTLSFPLLETPADEIKEAFQQIDGRLSDLPIIQSRIEEDGDESEGSVIRGDVERDVGMMLDKGKQGFDPYRIEEMTMGIFPSTAPTPTYLSQHWNTLNRSSTQQEDQSHEAEYEKLETLGRSSLELSTDLPSGKVRGQLGKFGEDLNIMDDTRTYTLLRHMAEQMDFLNDAYKHNNVIVLCPHCHGKSAAESGTHMNETVMAIDNSAERTDTRYDNDETLADMMSGKNQIIRSSQMKLDLGDMVWVCPLCQTRVAYGSDVLIMHKAQADLVYPMWDLFWQELDIERNRIRREKEAELRDTKKRVQSELFKIQKDFVEERRLIKTKTKELYEKSEKTIVQLNSMINAFERMAVFNSGTANEHRLRIGQYSGSHSLKLEQLQARLSEAEDEISEECTLAFQGRDTIIEYVDEVRDNGRFLTEDKEALPELLLVGGERYDFELSTNTG